MDWLVPALDATLAASLVLTLAYWYVYKVEKQRFLGIWTAAWAAALLRYAFMLIAQYLEHRALLLTLSQWFSLANAMLLLWGVYVYKGRRFPWSWLALAAIDTLWIPIAAAYSVSFKYLTAPTFLFMGAAVIWMGLVFMKGQTERLLSRTIVGWTMVLWGVHKLNYPLLRPIEWFAPIGYMLGALFSIMVAMGIILVYYEENRHMLASSEQRFRRLLNSAGDAIFVHDISNGRIADVNEYACQTLGYTREEMLALRPSEIEVGFPPEKIIDITRRLAPGSPGTVEGMHRRKDGSTFPVEVRLSLFEEEKENLVLAIVRDITERKLAAEALQESEETYRNMFLGNPQPMWLYDMETLRFLEVNNEAIVHYGYSRDEFLAMSIFDIRPEEDIQEFKDYLKTQLKMTNVSKMWRHKKRDGSIIYVEITSTVQSFRGVQAKLVMVNDVTDRVKVEDALRESEVKYRALFESSLAGVAVVNSEGRMAQTNSTMQRMLGYSADELEQLTFREVTLQDDIEENARLYQQLHEREIKSYQMEKRYVRKDGSVFWGSVAVFGIWDEAGQYRYAFAMVIDIEKRKQFETALAESEAQFRSLAENSPNMIFINCMGKIVYANQKCEEVMGYTRAELTSPAFDFRSLIVLEEKTDVEKNFKRHMLGEDVEPYEYTLVTKSGQRLDSIISTGRVSYKGTMSILGIVTDITEIRRAEQELKLTQFSVDNAADAVFWMDQEGRIFYANEAACRSLGYTKPELLSLSVPDIDSLVGPEAWKQHWEDLKREGTITMESIHKRKDGTEFPVEIIANHMEYGGREYNCAFVRDITARRLMEGNIRASLREKEVLLKEIHHRVKNNLQVISALFNMQLRHVTDPEARTQLQESRNRIRAMAMVHEKLYQTQDFSHIGLDVYLNSLLGYLFSSYTMGLPLITYEVKTDDVDLDTDTLVTIGLIVTELVSNALKHAFPEGRPGTVTVEFHDSGNNSGVLQVWDNGVGLPRDIDIRRAETLGLQLVDALVAQLRSGMKIGVPEEGGTSFVFEGIKLSGT